MWTAFLPSFYHWYVNYELTSQPGFGWVGFGLTICSESETLIRHKKTETFECGGLIVFLFSIIGPIFKL